MIYDHTKLLSCTKHNISELKREKVGTSYMWIHVGFLFFIEFRSFWILLIVMKMHLYNQSMDHQSRIEELSLDVENSAKAFDVSYYCIFVWSILFISIDCMLYAD